MVGMVRYTEKMELPPTPIILRGKNVNNNTYSKE